MENVKKELKEVVVIMKTSLTTIWFWFPILYAIYFFIQFWMMIYIHPLTILILPAILFIYALYLEEKRVEVAYDLNRIKVLRSSHSIGEGPITVKNKRNLDKIVAEYLSSLKRKRE